MWMCYSRVSKTNEGRVVSPHPHNRERDEPFYDRCSTYGVAMKTLLLLLISLTLVGCVAIRQRPNLSNPGRSEIIPDGQACADDADCVCISNAPDKCGETGQEWKCISRKCQLI